MNYASKRTSIVVLDYIPLRGSMQRSFLPPLIW